MKPITLLLGLLVLSVSTFPAAPPSTLLREDYQVIQRDESNRGHFRVALTDPAATGRYRLKISGRKNASVIDRVVKAESSDGGGQTVEVTDVPVGGPYRVEISPAAGAGSGSTLTFDEVLVGDLWVTGGQSNMFGAAIPQEDLPAIPGINVFDNKHRLLDAHWDAGKPPIHRNPADTQYGGRIGPAYFFARKLYQESGVPIGLIPCAMGGALAIWDPANRAKNRYGFMAHHIKAAGGRVRGMIWYQGEQDAIFGNDTTTVTKPSLIYPVSTYADRYAQLVDAMRHEFGGPEMPVILAQLNGHYQPPYYSVADYHDQHVEQKKVSTLMPGGVGWEKVREAQRQVAQRIPNVRLVSTIDLTLMDGLHLDYESQRTLGERMAMLALPFIKTGLPARPGIDVESARWGKQPNTIVVKFKGVTGRLQARGRPVGFEVRGPNSRTGEGESWVFRTDLVPGQPDSVILQVSRGAPRDGLLYYGSGAAPYANLEDESGLAVPAFGPVKIDPGAQPPP